MNVSVDCERLSRNLETIIGERSPFGNRRHLATVGNFIEAEFESYGIAVERDFFPWRGEIFHNVIARFPGSAAIGVLLSARTLIR